MPDRLPEQERRNIEGSEFPLTPPTERGSEKFPWKSLLLILGLTAVGVGIGSLVFKPLDMSLSDSTLGLRSLGTGAAGATGMGLGFLLTGGFNIFRENVVSLWGHGELHPKSPSLLYRG